MSNQLNGRIGSIQKRVLHLLQQNEKLGLKNTELEKKLENLKQQLETEQKKSGEVSNQIKIIKLAQNIGTADKDSSEVTELKRKINEYIKEIDHCIAMLNDWDEW